MPNERILVVDDEESILELLKYNLSKEGYNVTCVAMGEEAIEVARAKLPDLLVLDLMLPGVDGLEVCKTLKNDQKTANIPIVMLTAKGEEVDIVTGLELGADDYVTKPFSPRVLLARIKAVLRRKSVPADKETVPIKIGDLLIDSARYEATVKGRAIQLTSMEFKLLLFLASKPGRVFTRHQIIDSVKGDDYIVTDRSVDVQVVGLRKKLGPAGKYIETVRGVGYRFRD
jgi:two-component system phosphate regulon response regulator PhoB